MSLLGETYRTDQRREEVMPWTSKKSSGKRSRPGYSWSFFSKDDHFELEHHFYKYQGNPNRIAYKRTERCLPGPRLRPVPQLPALATGPGILTPSPPSISSMLYIIIPNKEVNASITSLIVYEPI